MSKIFSIGLTVFVLGVSSLFPAARANEHSSQAPSISDSDLPGHYIVVLSGASYPRGARSSKPKGVVAISKEPASRYGVKVGSVYKWAFDGYAAEVSKQNVVRLANDPSVAWVEPVRQFLATHGPKTLSPGPRFTRQRVLTGVDRVQADRSPTADIDQVDERVDVDVAVVDTGIDVDHGDLNVAGGTTCIPEPSFDDEHGHGTRVAGVVGALDNLEGVVGVAPGARLWAIRIFDAEAVGSLETALCGIDWITKTRLDLDPRNDIEVANMSFGTPPQPERVEDGNCGQTFEDVFHLAICRSVETGVTYTAAAGNDSANAARVAPAGYREVIAVSALSDFNGRAGARGRPSRACAHHLGEATSLVRDDAFAFFSNFGRAVDMIAPGVCILSTYLGGTYALASETSISAPHVAGGAALYKATHAAASPEEVKTALLGNGSFNWNDRGDPDPEKEALLNVAKF